MKDLRSTSCDKIFIEKPLTLNYSSVMDSLHYLEEVIADEGDIREALQKVVPTYHPAPIVSPHKIALKLYLRLSLLHHLKPAMLFKKF